jgi:Family of unknown function (DUF6644)
MERLLAWLGSTPWSGALLDSTWVWPLLESTHVLTMAVFFGVVALNDLRLLGWALTSVPVSEVTGRLLSWARGTFAVMAATGVLLFYSNPLEYYHNVFFRLKVLLLIVAGLNAFLFHRGIHRRVAEWDDQVVLPRAARAAGAVSLAAWVIIIVAGRLIAYNWFDCENEPRPAWVNWAAGCNPRGQ